MRKSLGRLLMVLVFTLLTWSSLAAAAPASCREVCIHGSAALSTQCTCGGQIIRCGNYWLGACGPQP